VTCYENHGNDSRITEAGDVRTHITARAGTGGGNLPLVLAHCQANAEVVRDGSPSLSCNHEAPIVAYGIDEECNGDGQGGTHQAVAFHVTQDPISGDVSPALSGGSKQGCGTVGVAQAFTQKQVGDVLTGDVAASMGTNQNASGRNTPKLQTGMTVRRLTPRECERLQGFEDDYTAIPWRGKPAPECPDGPRYKALGNSMAVPVMRWIGERIAMVEEVTG